MTPPARATTPVVILTVIIPSPVLATSPPLLLLQLVQSRQLMHLAACSVCWRAHTMLGMINCSCRWNSRPNCKSAVELSRRIVNCCAHEDYLQRCNSVVKYNSVSMSVSSCIAIYMYTSVHSPHCSNSFANLFMFHIYTMRLCAWLRTCKVLMLILIVIPTPKPRAQNHVTIYIILSDSTRFSGTDIAVTHKTATSTTAFREPYQSMNNTCSPTLPFVKSRELVCNLIHHTRVYVARTCGTIIIPYVNTVTFLTFYMLQRSN